MLKQRMDGRIINTIPVDLPPGVITALKAHLAGEVQEYKEVKDGGGGTVLDALPQNGLNAKYFSVGKVHQNGIYESCYVQIPHVKESVSFQDIRSSVIGNFDCSYDSTVKCDYANLQYDSSTGKVSKKEKASSGGN